MQKLTIYRHFLTNSDCYKSCILQIPKGIQVHSTGANNPYLHRYVGPDDGLLGANKYNNTHNIPGGDVCANAYIGKLQDGTPAIYQTLPWNIRCWLSASGPNGNANKLGYIGFEICEDNLKDKTYFMNVVMGLSVKLAAYLCKTYNIPLTNVLDHSELYKKGIGSNHSDITEWLKKFNLNMDMYRKAVEVAMKEGVEVEYIDTVRLEEKKSMYEAKVIAAQGNTVNMRSVMNTASNNTIIAKVPLGTIVEVLEEPSSTWRRIKYDGKVGYMMTQFLEKIEQLQDTSKDDIRKLKTKLEEALEIVNNLLNT